MVTSPPCTTYLDNADYAPLVMSIEYGRCTSLRTSCMANSPLGWGQPDAPNCASKMSVSMTWWCLTLTVHTGKKWQVARNDGDTLWCQSRKGEDKIQNMAEVKRTHQMKCCVSNSFASNYNCPCHILKHPTLYPKLFHDHYM